MTHAIECPTDEALQELLLGHGDPASADELERHVLTCSRCGEVAAGLHAEDSMVKAFRQVALTGDTPVPRLTDTLVPVFQRLRAAPDSGATGTWTGPATEAFLAPAELPDETGRLGPYAIHELLGSGVNDYDDAGLKLTAAAKDAKDIFEALGRDCVGTENRFGTAKGELLLDKDATRDRVLKALTDARKAAKPGDLVVIFFAGHGVKQGESYFLLTREADPSKDLKGKSLSGDDLRKVLAEIECPVLLVLDACHSANAVRSFRPATDDLTRSLTDDSVGVTVLSAAMAHEVAGATAENGHFTTGLLKGLKAGEGVPFDPYERQLYVHHLYSVAFSEVRRATNGKQNPFLNMPWTVPPLPLREIPVK